MNFGNQCRFPSTTFNIFSPGSNFENSTNYPREGMNMGNNQGVPSTVFNFYGNEMSSNGNSSEQSESSSSDSESDDDVDATNFNSFEPRRHTVYQPPSDSPYPDVAAQCLFRQNIVGFSSPDARITFETVAKIEMDIDFNEMISLVFLLYDSDIALQAIISMLENYEVNGSTNIVSDKLSSWARYKAHKQQINWKLELVEALAVIQNYKILQKLGYSRAEVNDQFHPTSDETRFLNRAKKMLFTLCDSLSVEQASHFIALVRAKKKFDNDITLSYGVINMELYVLFWMSRGIITIDKEVNVNTLTECLRKVGLSNEVVRIEGIVKKINEALQNKCNTEEKCVYEIKNPENVGLLVIINMVEFEKNVETRQEFKDQLPDCKLTDRTGSLQDVINLKGTFTRLLKFTVIIENDIKHDDLITEIEKNIQKCFIKGQHSVIFICILSHGKEGSIYAVNSVPVQIEEIKNIFFKGTTVANMLVDVPKVLIIQACQGTNHLFVESGLTTDSGDSSQQQSGCGQMRLDGPTRQDPYSDLLICLSIIDGFVSVRSTSQGSKYIQELCRCLKKYYDKKHFRDILVRVHRNVNAQDMHVTVKSGYGTCKNHKNCMNIYMTPWICWDTFRKDLYLTQQNRNM